MTGTERTGTERTGTERTGPEPIADLDLLAYADGLLDDDPGRKLLVEQWLEDRPAQKQRLQDYMQQNAALKQALNSRLQDPVPDRLYEALRPQRPRRRVSGTVAAACLVVVASVTSWMIGNRGDYEGWSAQQFVQQSFASLTAPARDDASYVKAAANQPPEWFTEKLALDFHVPDLSDSGYAVTARRSVPTDAGDMVKVEYVHRDGSRFNLFLQPRWKTQGPDIRMKRRDGYSMAYWLDGPLASAVVSDMPEDETARLANAVREAMKSPGTTPLTVQAAPIAPPEANGGYNEHAPVSPISTQTDPSPAFTLQPKPGVDRAIQ